MGSSCAWGLVRGAHSAAWNLLGLIMSFSLVALDFSAHGHGQWTECALFFLVGSPESRSFVHVVEPRS